MDDTRNKVISDIDAGENVMSVKPPFQLLHDQQRRYIRLEISEPITYTVVKNNTGGFWPQGDGPVYDGSILNLSAGGVLISSVDPVEEGSLLVLQMKLQDVEMLENVIGLVKRCDGDYGDWLIGVEFLSNDQLQDRLSSAELDMIVADIAPFDIRLREVLAKYVYHKRVNATNRGKDR
ncbi:MAG: PilZ domain-containing protein [candidate division Zixibacteria bacterium]|nr:PilZ domain-containing protein [candidate division Zixibacteria bacterium]